MFRGRSDKELLLYSISKNFKPLVLVICWCEKMTLKLSS